MEPLVYELTIFHVSPLSRNYKFTQPGKPLEIGHTQSCLQAQLSEQRLIFTQTFAIENLLTTSAKDGFILQFETSNVLYTYEMFRAIDFFWLRREKVKFIRATPTVWNIFFSTVPPYFFKFGSHNFLAGYFFKCQALDVVQLDQPFFIFILKGEYVLGYYIYETEVG